MKIQKTAMSLHDLSEQFIDEQLELGSIKLKEAVELYNALVASGDGIDLSAYLTYLGAIGNANPTTKHLGSGALEEMKKHETDFISITERIETNSPMGRAFFTVIACISQLERELIIERVKNGLKNARAKGKHIGRIKTRPSELIRAMLKGGATPWA